MFLAIVVNYLSKHEIHLALNVWIRFLEGKEGRGGERREREMREGWCFAFNNFSMLKGFILSKSLILSFPTISFPSFHPIQTQC